ncbi:hypothetical protein PR001_g597 [Phytophthora rubi]|uniref:Core-binding (CB) domain-containing protein n=1 Tax=Phytophthora rubi TaxID=129364 RepID=A0A6A3P9Q0_9STRA|nr:hypothetical protein PR001_g597 [Phytophthora rubi]
MEATSGPRSPRGDDDDNAEQEPVPFTHAMELDGAGVRARCIAVGTTSTYKSYLKGIRKWIMANKKFGNPQRFFTASGELDPTVFTPKEFEAFLLAKRKDLKAVTLGGYRSAMKDLYRRNNVPVPDEYGEGMKTLLSGIKRLQVETEQTADVRSSGKRALTYSMYEKLCSTMLGRNDGGFAHLFLTTQWNLMCRSKSVETLRTSRLLSAEDSIGCVLHKAKTNQEGSGPKDPRHMYANPDAPATCWVTALAVYLACNPRQKPGALFPGSNQKLRFEKALAEALKSDDNAKSYGTHSIRKGVASYACSGSTGGPSIVSVCLRCGWSLGGVQDRYFRYESAGDQFLGRVIAGLPLNKARFAALPPHFSSPVSSTVEVDVARVFPGLVDADELRPILHLCLASLVYHGDYLLENLAPSHALLSTYLFRDPIAMARLRSQVITCDSPWMRPTGTPPYIEIYKQLEETRSAVIDLPDVLLRGISTMLDEKAVSSGNITRDVLKQTIKELLAEAGIGATIAANPPPSSTSFESNNIRVHFWDNKFHFLPASFEFPSADPLTAWKLWWLGNVALGYPPFRRVTSRDLSTRQKANTLSEWSMLMTRICAEVEAATGSAVSAVQTEEEADNLFEIGMSRLKLLPTFRERRHSQLKVTTVVRLMREANKASDPNARSLPFRSRKRQKTNSNESATTRTSPTSNKSATTRTNPTSNESATTRTSPTSNKSATTRTSPTSNKSATTRTNPTSKESATTRTNPNSNESAPTRTNMFSTQSSTTGRRRPATRAPPLARTRPATRAPPRGPADPTTRASPRTGSDQQPERPVE